MPQPNPPTTLAEARDHVRAELLDVVDVAGIGNPFLEEADLADLNADYVRAVGVVKELAATFNLLARAAEWEAAQDAAADGPDPAVDEALDAGRALLGAADGIHAEDFPPRLEQLAAPLDRLANAYAALDR